MTYAKEENPRRRKKPSVTLPHARTRRVMKTVTREKIRKQAIDKLSQLAIEYMQELTELAEEDPRYKMIMPESIEQAHQRYQNQIVKDKFEPQARELKETSEKVIETLKWLR